MNIAVVGLAFTHPYTYTKILLEMGHRVTHVWDDDPDRLAGFVSEYGAVPVASPAAVPGEAIDGAIVTARFPERVDHALMFLERGVPTYSSKPLAAKSEQLRRLGEAVRRTGTPLLSTSVLRYAPALRSLRRHVDENRLGTLLAVRGVCAHPIERYMTEPDTWQDDPERGGGTIINMGIHALEMLSVVVGYKINSVGCRSGRRLYPQSLSEDVALFTVQWEDGLLGSLEVLGGVNSAYFAVQVYGSERTLRCTIPKGDVQDLRGAPVGDADHLVEEGYTGTMAAFVEMCCTREMPVPLEESETIARVLLAARQAAASGLPVSPDTVA